MRLREEAPFKSSHAPSVMVADARCNEGTKEGFSSSSSFSALQRVAQKEFLPRPACLTRLAKAGASGLAQWTCSRIRASNKRNACAKPNMATPPHIMLIAPP